MYYNYYKIYLIFHYFTCSLRFLFTATLSMIIDLNVPSIWGNLALHTLDLFAILNRDLRTFDDLTKGEKGSDVSVEYCTQE